LSGEDTRICVGVVVVFAKISVSLKGPHKKKKKQQKGEAK
jgi:hypothetical protein